MTRRANGYRPRLETLESRLMLDGDLANQAVDASTLAPLDAMESDAGQLAAASSSVFAAKSIAESYGQCIYRDLNSPATSTTDDLPKPPSIYPLSELAQRPKSNPTTFCDLPIDWPASQESGGSGGSGGTQNTGEEVDIDVDSDNMNFLERSLLEDDVELLAPGSIVHLNWNDDDNSGTEDRHQTIWPPGLYDGDLEPVALEFSSGGADPEGMTLTLSWTGANSIIRLWSSQDKDKRLATPETYTIGTDYYPGTVFVEGIEFGTATITWRVSAQDGTPLATDTVRVTVSDMNATAYRPQIEEEDSTPSYDLFGRLPIPEENELSPGAGIRRNGDFDVPAEDDLIEVEMLVPAHPGIDYTLEKSNTKIDVWNDAYGLDPLLVGSTTSVTFAGSGTRTVWVEWVDMQWIPTEDSVLSLTQLTNVPAEPLVDNVELKNDAIRFYPFDSIIMVWLGEFQAVGDNTGTKQMAQELYENGYDVHLFDESDCAPGWGSGTCSTAVEEEEVRSAIEERLVSQVALMGYSHGGGMVYQFWQEMQQTQYSRAYTLQLTAYVDAINWWTLGPQIDRPPSVYHVNQYQQNTGASGLWLNGAPSSPLGNDDIDRSYMGVNHSTIDDHVDVIDLNITRVLQNVDR